MATTLKVPAENLSNVSPVDDAEIETVVVTARRRVERAQDIPVSLSVVGGQTLDAAGVSSLNQAQQLIPSLQVFSFNPRNTNINIRGLGSNVALTNDGLENGVGFYVDGVYYGRPGQTQFDLVDIAQIEVLRGPQGTLFGKNTTAGAINITTRLPSFTPETSYELSVGEYGNNQIKLQTSGPLGENVAFRVTGSYTHRDGFIELVRRGETSQAYENLAFRAQLLVNLGDNARWRLIGDWADQKQLCCVAVLAGFQATYDNGNPIPDNFLQRSARLGYTPIGFDAFARVSDIDSPIKADQSAWGLSSEVNWDLGFADLTAISAYRVWDWYPSNDADGIGLPITVLAQQQNNQQQASQEIRLASRGESAVEWLVGAYYFWQVVDGYGRIGFGPAAAAWNLPTVPALISNAALSGFSTASFSSPETRSVAVFGQATWSITDALNLTAGLRYTDEEKTGVWRNVLATGADLSTLPTPAAIATAQALRNNFSPTGSLTTGLEDQSVSGLVSIAYDLTDDILLYGSYAVGAKSGGLNLAAVPAGVSAVVQPEDVSSVEGGIKSAWLDGALVANLAIYQTTISNYQTAITEQVGTTTAFRQYISNIPEVRSRGFELDVAWSPTRSLALTAAFAYTDAVYVDYRNAPQRPEVAPSGIQDLSGRPLSGVPEVTWSFSADYSRPTGTAFGSQTEAYIRSDYSNRGEYYTSASNSRFSLVPAYDLLNLRAGWRAVDGGWDISVYARNLLNEEYFLTRGLGAQGQITGTPGDPRVAGITFKGRF